jgi:hypothetical protein
MSRRNRVKIAAETNIDPRTVDKWVLHPETVGAATAYALAAACKKLGIVNPHEVPGGRPDSHDQA